MDPAGKRVFRNGDVQIMRQAQMHDIQIFMFDHDAVIGIGGATVQRRRLVRAVFFNIAAGDEFGDAAAQLHRIEMHDGNSSAADHADPQFLQRFNHSSASPFALIMPSLIFMTSNVSATSKNGAAPSKKRTISVSRL